MIAMRILEEHRMTRTQRVTKDTKTRRATRICTSIVACLAIIVPAVRAARATLDIYFIDVEGGQSTLFVTPAGESLLVDTGFAGDGTFNSSPGDPARARDAQRILAAARDAGVTRIDYLLITHFHADHDGGVVELAQLLPIGTFVDHGNVLPVAEENVKGTLQAFERYAAVRAKGRHLAPAPGARLPLKGVEASVVSAAGSTIVKPLAGAGTRTPGCAPNAPPPDEPNENPRSTGFQLRFGKFRVLDAGDLSGPPLFALACPTSLVGPIDVYVVAHHGGGDAADPATFAAFRPRVAVLNNGATKGGAPETFAALHAVPGMDDVWQLHRSTRTGARNFADNRIANLDESTAHWIKVSARADGSFTVTNGRTGRGKDYLVRR
jgi:beta-lactamase superfamily II metal-dependent hydrolase